MKQLNSFDKSILNLFSGFDNRLDLNYEKIREFNSKNDLDFDDKLYLFNFNLPEASYLLFVKTMLDAREVKHPEEIILMLLRNNCTVRTIRDAIKLIYDYDYDLNFNSKIASDLTYGDHIIYLLCDKNDFRLFDIYDILVNNCYRPNVSNLDNGFTENVEKFISSSMERLTKFQNKFFYNEDGNFKLSKDEFETLNNNGILLNNKVYKGNQVVGREKELENLIISLAQDKKCPILVGESGVGKTAIVDELVYRIKTNMVPKFLCRQPIYELRVNRAIAGTRYRGEFEEKIKKIIEICLERNFIVFIDEIQSIYGMGAANENPNDLASILKMYIDRDNLRVIGTTTDFEYGEYFASDALKRRFDKIIIKEPEYNVMHEIIRKVINDYSMKNGISSEKLLENNPGIIDIILTATCKKHRTYDDIVNNPDLTVSIIDKAFAYAKVLDSEELEIRHLIKSFEMCDRIYESAKDNAVKELKALSETRKDKNNQYIKIHKPTHN